VIHRRRPWRNFEAIECASYRSRRPPDTTLRARLRELANERRRFGYRRLFILLRRAGEPSWITSISGRRVARELTTIVEHRGKPGSIVSDNGTEFTCNAMLGLMQGHRHQLALHRAGAADPVAFVESFNGRMRDE
jgi:transposase InsO family protein